MTQFLIALFIVLLPFFSTGLQNNITPEKSPMDQQISLRENKSSFGDPAKKSKKKAAKQRKENTDRRDKAKKEDKVKKKKKEDKRRKEKRGDRIDGMDL